jgi:hypothetical protein
LKNCKKFLLFLAAACWLFPATPEAGEVQTPQFEQPLLITSAGQSAEVQLAVVLARRAELDFTLVKLATSEDLAGKKTLVLSLGASLKGLGAAGLDVAQEKGRVEKLLAAAKAQGLPILCLHLGGEARRGQLSDDFISSFLPHANLAIVVKSGNADGFFSSLCEQKKITLIEVNRTPDALKPLRDIFNPTQ